MKSNKPKRHHYVPQFFLRNFAFDAEKKKVGVVRKFGQRAVWAETSIKSIGYESEFYLHTESGVSVSVESDINRQIETPLTTSETWHKIVNGLISDLDVSDRSVLYSLVRNLEVRTPHYLQISGEITKLNLQNDTSMRFSSEENLLYSNFRSDPSLIKATLNTISCEPFWNAREFHSCAISVYRTQSPVFVCTTPVCPVKVPAHPALRSVQLGLDPVSLLMPLSPHAYIFLTMGDFDGQFSNMEIQGDIELAFKRQIVGQFAYWPTIEHMICPQEDLHTHMEWAEFDLLKNSSAKIEFVRRVGSNIHQSV